MNDCIIRPIKDQDRREVECMTRRAFWNVNMPGCDEHYYVHRLWEDEAYLPKLSLVAEKNSQIIGAIIYIRTRVETSEGKTLDTLTFGPLCVDPPYQRTGVGGALLTRSMENARALGHSSIFICGVPAYYPRFGFKPASAFGVTMPDGSSFDAFMAIELTRAALDGVSGKFYEPEVCVCDVHDPQYMEAVEEFDKAFPYLEKKVLPHQWR